MSREQHRASFETAASRLPQDEVFLNAIKAVPHPEEARSAVSKDAQPPHDVAVTSSKAARVASIASFGRSRVMKTMRVRRSWLGHSGSSTGGGNRCWPPCHASGW